MIPPAFWLIGAYFENPPDGYFREILFGQTVERAGGSFGRVQPLYYYLYQFPLDFLPWTLVLPFVFRKFKPSKNNKLLIAWFLAIFILFSLIPSKRNLYILAAYPAAAIFVALAWDDLKPRLLNRFAAYVILAFYIAGTIVYPVFDGLKTPVGIREAVAPYLAPDPSGRPRLALVGTNGEIYALYAGARGIIFWVHNDGSPRARRAESTAFSAYLASKPRGAAVVEHRFWLEYGDDITRILDAKSSAYEVRDMAVGKKRLRNKSDKLLLWKNETD